MIEINLIKKDKKKKKKGIYELLNSEILCYKLIVFHQQREIDLLNQLVAHYKSLAELRRWMKVEEL